MLLLLAQDQFEFQTSSRSFTTYNFQVQCCEILTEGSTHRSNIGQASENLLLLQTKRLEQN